MQVNSDIYHLFEADSEAATIHRKIVNKSVLIADFYEIKLLGYYFLMEIWLECDSLTKYNECKCLNWQM